MVTTRAQIDSILRHLIAAYEGAFAECELSYYLIGSWAEGEANALSNIDVAIVWTPAELTEDHRAHAERILARLASPIRLDVGMMVEHDVPASPIGVNLKLSSTHLSGPDIRERLPLPPLEQYTQSAVEAAYVFMSRILRGTEASDDINYPDPEDEFFGYARKRVEAWYPAEITSGLKEWVSTATRIVRALVAMQHGRYVGSKGEAIAAYRTDIGDDWSPYLSTLYGKGKIEWAYRVPDDEDERVLLRELCRRFLAFERHFLAAARQYRVYAKDDTFLNS